MPRTSSAAKMATVSTPYLVWSRHWDSVLDVEPVVETDDEEVTRRLFCLSWVARSSRVHAHFPLPVRMWNFTPLLSSAARRRESSADVVEAAEEGILKCVCVCACCV